MSTSNRNYNKTSILLQIIYAIIFMTFEEVIRQMENNKFSFRKFFTKKQIKMFFKSIRITSQVIWNLLLIMMIIGASLLFFVGGAAAGYFASLVKDEPIRSFDEMKRDIYDYEEATEVYFADGILLGDLPSPLERREVSLDEISQYVIDAVIATEDEYFYEHQGIVPKAVLRALYQDFSNAPMQTGGSTITQQLIKNQILTSEVTHDRKAAEILLALRLEHFFEKDEILEAYLNVVPFGRNSSGRQIAGVQAAAQGIFGVDAKDLNLPQAAYIAGLPQSPFAYTPFTPEGEVKENIDAGLNRMKTVLNRMLDSGFITEEEYEEALAYDIRANLIPPKRDSYDDYPHITEEVRRRATIALAKSMMEEDGIDLNEIEDEDQRNLTETRYLEEASRKLHRDGYRIYTTINKEIYDTHQKVVQEFPYYAWDMEERITTDDGEVIVKKYPEEAAAVLVDNRTGAIVSFVPNRTGDFHDSQFNFATQARRHTGSTMKPLLTYAIGFEAGVIQPGFITPDTPYNYPGTDIPVNNFDRRHMGLMTAREAMQRSRNVPAVREFMKIPHDMAREALINYGFEDYLIGNEPFPSTALGTIDMTVEANVGAFSTFANYGKRKELYMIERIETSDGEVVYEHEEEETKVFSEQTAYLMIDMMRDVLRTPGTAAGLPGQLNFTSDLVGKTGTSDDIRDSWFVGLNPNFTMGVWLGYEQRFGIPQRAHGYSYGQRTQMLWARLANATYEIYPEFMAPEERFQAPAGIVSQSICGISGKLPSDLCREAGLVTTDLFNSKFVPTEVDDSLKRVRYVQVDGEYYIALESTPIEFTNEGISVKEEYFEFADGNIEEYIPDSWDMLIPDIEAPDDGKTPDPLTSVRASKNGISWSEHHEGDVIGYRIYHSSEEGRNFTLVGSVKWDEEFSFSGPEGAYVVTAVDVAGRESEPSDPVIIGDYFDSDFEDDEEDKDDKKDKKDDKTKPPHRERDERSENEDNENNNNHNNENNHNENNEFGDNNEENNENEQINNNRARPETEHRRNRREH